MITREELTSNTGFYFSHYDEYDGSEIYKSHKNKNYTIARYDDNFFIDLSEDPTKRTHFSTSSTGRFIKTVDDLITVINYLYFLKGVVRKYKVDKTTKNIGEYEDWYMCPNCKSNELHDSFEYCPFCGVALEFDTYYGIDVTKEKNEEEK